jgi:tetratricopeptide (TPR) repeat protein
LTRNSSTGELSGSPVETRLQARGKGTPRGGIKLKGKAMGNRNRFLFALLIGAVLCSAALAQTAGGKMPITTSSEAARTLYLQARDLRDRVRFLEALPLLERAVALDSNFALAYRDLAEAQTNFVDYQKLLNKAAALVDRVSECEKYSILASDAAGKLNVAKQHEYLGRLVEKCPQDERAHFQLGSYFFFHQIYDSAAAELQRAVDIEPNYSFAWNLLGYAKKNMGDLAGAEKVYLKYIELLPREGNPYDSYAELLLKMGRYDEAVTRYRQALTVDSTFVTSLFSMAAPLVYLGRYDDARRELQDMLKRATNDGTRQTAYYGLAVTAADEGKLDDAIAAVQQSEALSAKVNDVNAVSQNAATIGFLRLEQQRWDDAGMEYERAWTLVKNADLAPAIKAFTERNLLYCQARMASGKGEHAQATAFADSFMTKAKIAGSVDDVRLAHELCGIIALNAKHFDRAVTDLQQANPESGYNNYRLALAYNGLGDKAKALAHIKVAAHINTVLALNDVLQRKAALRLEKEWSGK